MPSVTSSVTEAVPGAVGVPVITLPSSVSPTGNVPLVIAQVNGAVPPLATSARYTNVPVTRFGAVGVVITLMVLELPDCAVLLVSVSVRVTGAAPMTMLPKLAART